MIEHEYGYRAKMAEVLARAIVDGVGLLCVSDSEEIDEVFGSGRDQVGDRCEPASFALEEAIEYLQQEARRYQCTLANN